MDIHDKIVEVIFCRLLLKNNNGKFTMLLINYNFVEEKLRLLKTLLDGLQ